MTAPALRFALDHNFPQPLVEQLGPYFPEAALVPIGSIDARLARLDDWDVLLALHHLGGWSGLVTCDAAMLNLPRVLAVRQVWRLTAAEKRPHDPWEEVKRIAAKERVTANHLYEREKLSDVALALDPLAGPVGRP
jgi:hypothetical protein